MSIQLLKSTVVTGSMTLISRVLGFIRDLVSAHYFGASSGYDAFVVASKIPNFFRRLFAEGAFSQAFVPILSEYRVHQPHDDVQLFVNRVAGCLSLVLTAVTILGIIFAPLFILMFAPGFVTTGEGNRYALASEMLRITFPYLLFVSLTAFAGGILNSYGRFAGPAFTPVFLNIAIIAAAIFLAPHLAEPVTALAWGILLGGIIQLLFQWPFLVRLRLLPRLEFNWKDKGVRRILLLMFPALLGVSVNQLNLMLSSIFASFLPEGSVSWLYYAERLMEFPLGGFAVALATVVLPRLAQHHSVSEHSNFAETLDWGVRWIMLVGFPAAIGLALLAGPLLTTLFQSGKFTDHDVLMSQPCLMAYALGIMGFMCVKIFASAYYAKQDIKTPVKIAMVTVVANLVFSSAFIVPFAQMGLALATSLAALMNASILAWILIKRKIFILQPGWGAFALQLSLACLAMASIIYYFNPGIEEWFAFDLVKRISTLALLIVASGLAYIMTLFVTGLRIQHLLVKTS
jgi:putative peptidoglycan lipid II flippase